MSDYSEKLKDPRWQKKRLEILDRDGWMCRSCGETQKTLTVHHLFYLPNTEPWDVPAGFLITFYDNCHNPKPCMEYKSCKQCPDFRNDCDGPVDPRRDFIDLIGNMLDLFWRNAPPKEFKNAVNGLYSFVAHPKKIQNG